MTTGRQRIEWNCYKCGRPIAPSDGILRADVDAARGYPSAPLADDDDPEADVPETTDQWAPPQMATPWLAYHDRCAPPEDQCEEYVIPLHEVSTPRGFLGRLAHIIEKRWVREGTNLRGLIIQALDGITTSGTDEGSKTTWQ